MYINVCVELTLLGRHLVSGKGILPSLSEESIVNYICRPTVLRWLKSVYTHLCFLCYTDNIIHISFHHGKGMGHSRNICKLFKYSKWMFACFPSHRVVCLANLGVKVLPWKHYSTGNLSKTKWLVSGPSWQSSSLNLGAEEVLHASGICIDAFIHIRCEASGDKSVQTSPGNYILVFNSFSGLSPVFTVSNLNFNH